MFFKRLTERLFEMGKGWPSGWPKGMTKARQSTRVVAGWSRSGTSPVGNASNFEHVLQLSLIANLTNWVEASSFSPFVMVNGWLCCVSIDSSHFVQLSLYTLCSMWAICRILETSKSYIWNFLKFFPVNSSKLYFGELKFLFLLPCKSKIILN